MLFHKILDGTADCRAGLTLAATEERRAELLAGIAHNEELLVEVHDSYSGRLWPHITANGAAAIRELSTAELLITLAEARRVDWRRYGDLTK